MHVFIFWLSLGNLVATYKEITTHSVYNVLRYNNKYMIVNLVSSHLGFWNGNFFLIAPFPDHCLLLPFDTKCLYSKEDN